MQLREILLEQKRSVIQESYDAKAEELRSAKEAAKELEPAIKEAKTDEDFKALNDKIDKTDEEIKKLSEELEAIGESLKANQKELDEAVEKSKEAKEAAKEAAEEKENKEVTTVEEKRNKAEELVEVRSAINAYIRSRGAKQERADGFKVVDGGALIPKEILAPAKKKEDTVDLSKYVRTVKVNTGSGVLPVLSKSKAKMNTVEELVENPDLAKPAINEVDFKIKTYRGALAVSNEVIDDAQYDVLGLISEDINNQELNTRNFAIAEVMKKARAVDAKGLDGIKTAVNKEVPMVYNSKIFVTKSLYNELDLLKDKNGRYMIQPDVTKESGEKLFNKELVVVDDTILGDEGALKAFYGDLYEFVTYFDRKQTTVGWDYFDGYGKKLGCATRFDVVKTAEDAGVLITYTAAV